MTYSKEFVEVVEQELDQVNPSDFKKEEVEECNGKFYYLPFFEDLKIEFENGP